MATQKTCIQDVPPNVAIVDIRLLGISGIECVRQQKNHRGALRTLLMP